MNRTLNLNPVRGLALAVLAAAVGLSLASCGKRAEAAPRPPRLVTASKVERSDFVLSTEYAARLVPALEVNITPKVGGRVTEVLAEVGMAVAEGQTLCTLDASDYDAQYRQAKAALGSAQAALTRTSDSGREQQTLQARSAADQAQIGYDEAKSAYDRTKRLYDSGSVSRQQFQEVEARYKASGIQRDAANQALALVEDKAGSQANEIASGQVDQAGAQAELAKSQLDAAVIRSPVAGRVSYRNVEAGEFVGNSTLVFVVIDERRVVAETGLSERVVGSVRKGMSMELVVPAAGVGRLAGTVDSVSPSADPRTMLYTVRLNVPNHDDRLRGGMLARVRIPLTTRVGALLVPEKATFSENGGDYVFVVSAVPDSGSGTVEGLASRRLVRLGESDGSRVEAIEGLAAGDLVITEGQEFLGDGDRVKIAPAP
jgi:RND family efflux transporter MFP subunit